MKDLNPTGLLLWDDFAPGQSWTFGDYAVTEAEIIDFANRYDPLPMHLDRDRARDTPLGIFCASGIHTFAIGQRLLVDNLYIRCRLIAGGQMKHFRMHRPVEPGDRLSMKIDVLATTPHSRRPDAGWIDFWIETRGTGGDTVLEYEVRVLFGRALPEAAPVNQGSPAS